MKIAIAADHRGLKVKDRVNGILQSHGHEVVDVGTHSEEAVDYPDFGIKASRMVADGKADRAVLVCWTGNGMGMAANKVRGVRAGIATNRDMAYFTRLHNDANVLVLGSKYIPDDKLEEVIMAFVSTEFEGGRHIARLQKIAAAEQE